MNRPMEAIHLLEADPDLGGLLSDARRTEAERELVVRTHRLPVGPWDVTRLSGASGDHIGLLILEGVLARELLVADQISAELLGPGDVVRPWQGASRSALLPVDAVWSVLSSLTVAVLDRRFAAEAARYPEITAALFDRLGERSLRLATTQAISQLTRVDRRLKALFWHLAERWGRVGGDGVVVPLALTHRILGQLVGARRPTGSTALRAPAERGGPRAGSWASSWARAARRSRRRSASSPSARSSCAGRTARGCCAATRRTPRRWPAARRRPSCAARTCCARRAASRASTRTRSNPGS